MVDNPAPGGSSAPAAVTVANVPTIFGVFSAASYASATISPGELVTMFGSNIGPAIPATMAIAAGYADYQSQQCDGDHRRVERADPLRQRRPGDGAGSL